ncbi:MULTISPECIES: Stk1 family PASTA domain-containing Ser/Thr kinase [Rhodococcus]|uniref:Stk1 family PASTA domain-containing Ser/Thr kinase n=1 Tax=Rhodococcus TaxID=1827 RepID=UPI000EB30B0C|nr:Stk1 family PASTA domain-containing Ser/Thr kinase [Rhodococcus pyridinivorans]MCD2116878.1 Stk1 family PASTA domain-containing Ser/Thr kinase [Rhodococcus pyridinivorans]MCZ4625914.1 Stk1 family PASTA domain-containing Ser/Thr kinase [Rhodococcus pyridinivorans]MCZ4646869.1 Stk1 family PASTA domain-containing Ser/Thr kinase [Rhodococcus pyridinivorans]MDJ0480221.1 Stk1 family PASTA domain-containing Ser/Thr kinase [Rhodococcus pyridinivorans]MDV7252973.1 Stk1 family PASTA domain-containing
MTAGGDRLVGVVLDRRYRIESQIARGGMSTVYRGTDMRLDRPVAVKIMDPQFAADPQFLARFEFEARSVARLTHPGLVAVYDQGQDGDHVFLVMELVEGGTLRELLRERGPMPPHAAAAVAAPVLGALAVAHRAGLVHRDIKPENILISGNGEVKIADFGLVRAVAAATTTSRSVILGTAAYLSPEQVTIGSADARSDVYSAGVLVYEMLTGRTPFTGDTSLSVAYQRVEKDVPDPSSAIDGVPPELDAFVRRATEREPTERYADAQVMAVALGEICDTLDLPRYRVPAPRRSAVRTPPVVDPDAAAPTRTIDGAASGPADPAPATTVLTGSAANSHAPTTVQTAVPATPGPNAPATRPHPTRVATRTHPRPDTEPVAPPPDYAVDRRRQRRSAAGWIAAIIVLALFMGIAGWWLGAGRLSDVPTVLGLDKAAAVSAIEAAGLSSEIRGEYSDDVPVDTVLGTDPTAGSRVPDGDTIALLVSLGRPTVPSIPGAGERSVVEDELRSRTFEPVEGGTAFSTTVPEGGVAALDPAPGTVLPVGSEVALVISKGSPPVTLPDLTGRPVDEARRILDEAGLTVGDIREVFDADVDEGRVIGTDPEEGEDVSAGGTVTLLVSNAVKVPSMLGRSVGSARDELTRLGFEVEVRQLGDSDRSVVIGQNPGAGRRAEQGSTVTLTALP